jgi:hypothetical protein
MIITDIAFNYIFLLSLVRLDYVIYQNTLAGSRALVSGLLLVRLTD